LAVKIGAVATPLATVFTVTDVTDPGKVPLAPLAGAANVTAAPLTGLFRESLTVAWSCVAKAELMAVLCGVPTLAVMLDAVPPVPLAALNAATAAPQLSLRDNVALAAIPPAVP
jgi:hypothetical protein